MGLILGSGKTNPQYPYYQWYGVEGDFTSNDYKLTRVGNMDLHRTLPIQNKLRRYIENPDGSVKYYLHQNDSRKKESGVAAIIDSTDGNVMLEKPEYYFRLEINGTKWIRAWSEYPLPGFIKMERKAIAPFYSTIDLDASTAVSGCWLLWDNNDELVRDENGILVLANNAPRYRGGSGARDASRDGTASSQLGMPRTSVNKDTVRATCKNGTHHGVWRAYNEIAWLQRLEYASLHSQDGFTNVLMEDGFKTGGLGSGPSVSSSDWNIWGDYRPFIPSGVTSILGNNTGKVSYTIKNFGGGDKVVQVTSYRGLENPFEYLWMLADDVLVYHNPTADGIDSIAYVCENPELFTSHSNLTTEIPNGYIGIANIPRTPGYILQLTHSDKGYSFPQILGASGNTGACDYYYTPSAATTWGWFGSLLSGNANNGTNAGFGVLYTDGRSSNANANIGFRLCRF